MEVVEKGNPPRLLMTRCRVSARAHGDAETLLSTLILPMDAARPLYTSVALRFVNVIERAVCFRGLPFFFFSFGSDDCCVGAGCCWRLIESPCFTYTIALAVLLNCIQLCMVHRGQPEEWEGCLGHLYNRSTRFLSQVLTHAHRCDAGITNNWPNTSRRSFSSKVALNSKINQSSYRSSLAL